MTEDEFLAIQGSRLRSGDWIASRGAQVVSVSKARAEEIMTNIQLQAKLLVSALDRTGLLSDSPKFGPHLFRSSKDVTNDLRGLLGYPCKNGCWHYPLPGESRVAWLSAASADQFFELTQAHSTIMCRMLDVLNEQGESLESNEPVTDNLLMPEIDGRIETYIFKEWHQSEGSYFLKGDRLFSVKWSEEVTTVYADKPGLMKKHLRNISRVRPGELLAHVEWWSRPYLKSESSCIAKTAAPDVLQAPVSTSSRTTASVINDRSLATGSAAPPEFKPSVASIPTGFPPSASAETDLAFALENPELAFQSFFNDLQLVVSGSLSDDVISLPSFDEDMYARLVKEMHRYTLTEVADKKDDLAKENARLGTFVGSLLGLLTMNPLAPFMGRNLGRLETNRGKRIAEFLPDPHLLFYQDEHSFLSWSRAQVIAPRIRRIIFSRMTKEDGSIYFRLLPALVTQSQRVLPIQIFKVDSQSYFYRPFAAGIDRQQGNYDSIKVLRRYSHFHVSSHSSPTDIKLTVSGRDVETSQKTLFRYQDDSLDYCYADFMIPPGFVF